MDEATPSWATSLYKLRDSYRAMRQAIDEHPDKESLVRRYEELYAEFQLRGESRERNGDVSNDSGK